MATHLSRQRIALNEIDLSYSGADPEGNTYECGDRVFLHVKNNNPASTVASAIVVVADLHSEAPEGGGDFDPDVTVVVPAQEGRYLGPLYTRRFGETDTHYGTISYDDATNIEVAVVELSTPG